MGMLANVCNCEASNSWMPLYPRIRRRKGADRAALLAGDSLDGNLLLEEHRVRHRRRRLVHLALLVHGEDQGQRLLLVDRDGTELRGDVRAEEVRVLQDRFVLVAGEQP